MKEEEDLEPLANYIANRLVGFSRNYSKRSYNFEEIAKAKEKGIIEINGIIFEIKNDRKSLEVLIKLLDDSNWERLKKQLNRANDPEFWKLDFALLNLKKTINHYSNFLINRKIYTNEEKKEILVQGKFNSNNKKDSYFSVLNCIVRPLLFYNNFPK
jgi:hypothetical protein